LNKEFSSDDLVNIGLTSTISLTLNKNLPKSRILKELDENLCKYAQDDVSDEDIVRIAKRITNKQLTDIEELNSLAENNKEEFTKRLNEEAEKQKEIESKTVKKLDTVFKAVKNETTKYYNLRKKLEDETKTQTDELTDIRKALKDKDDEFFNYKKDVFIEKKLKHWRLYTIAECTVAILIVVAIILYLLNLNDWNFDKTIEYYKGKFVINTIISIIMIFLNGFFFKSLYDKYRNHSNIENFKKNIKIPKEL